MHHLKKQINKHTKNRSKNGFSIVEVLVAAGILSVVALGISSVVSNTMKQQKGVQAKDQQREVSAIVRNILKDSKACEFTFAGRTLTVAPSVTDNFFVTEIRDETLPAGIVRLQIPGTDQTGLLRYDQFQVAGLVTSGTNDTAVLSVKLSKVGNDNGVKDLKIDPITLRITRNAGGVITTCNALGASGGASFWGQSANGTDIFFNTGNVGIGTATPVAGVKLHVEGGDFGLGNMSSAFDAGPFPNGGGPKIYLNGFSSQNSDPMVMHTVFLASDASDLRISVGDNTGGEDSFSVGNYGGGPTWTPWLSVVNNGNVGIGTNIPGTKLDVNGTLRPGAATLNGACSPVGAQGYISAAGPDLGAPLYCDGIIWKKSGGGASFSGCIDYTATGTNASSVSCPAATPNPLRGGCNPVCLPSWRNEIVGSTQICSVTTFLNGASYCTGAGQNDVTARITCCP